MRSSSQFTISSRNFFFYNSHGKKKIHQAAILTLTVCVWQSSSQGFLIGFYCCLIMQPVLYHVFIINLTEKGW